MEIRTLESASIETIHGAFVRAFSDYLVPMNLSALQLAELHRRRGVRLDLSVGVFEQGELVGFTFNGIDEWAGARTGYDAGTGVAPSARGHGLSTLMLDRTKEVLSGVGATRYLLEVIQSNFTAYRIYLKAGFTATRELRCWRLESIPRRGPEPNIEVLDSLESIPVEEMWDWTPSWQNSLESIARASEDKKIVCTRTGDEVTGYAVVFSSGEIAQFAVAKSERRRGTGAALLRQAQEAFGRRLRILNTDANDDGTNRFLEALGANEAVRQYEMVMDL